jgi:hypothetical protein
MRGVGYISGDSLSLIQDQWGQLIDAGVNVILFDRYFIQCHFEQPVPSKHAAEAESMWRYMETMRAGQDISGNYDNYQALEDLQPGDTLVLTELETLRYAEPGVWKRIFTLYTNGVHLAITSNGFHSAGEFGDVMLTMMNTAHELGQRAATIGQDDTGSQGLDDNPDPVVARVYAFLGDQDRSRFELIPCDGMPEGWYRTFDPTGWCIFAVIDTNMVSIGSTHHVAVNPDTLEVRDLGSFGE